MALFLILIFILKHFFNNNVDSTNKKKQEANLKNKLENLKEKRRELATQISHQAERYGIQEIHIVE